MSHRTKIKILAGEASGDLLGGSLMQAMRSHQSNMVIEGIGGPEMLAQGLQSQVPMERLAVMGLFEPLKRLPELLRIKRHYVNDCLANRPDLFVGIDSPDFNLRVAAELHKAGIKTAHYVSPSVWAWRQKRVIKIRQNVDLMLTLFPFEEEFYQQHGVPVRFVGHPLADSISLEQDAGAYRRELGLDETACYVAVLPGSRLGESKRMMPLFKESMAWLAERRPDITFLVPAANDELHAWLEALFIDDVLFEKVQLLRGRAQQVMGASNAVLLASGTSTLEAMLLKKPMVMAYCLSELTYKIVKRMIKLPYFSLPNLLAGEQLVKEFIQHDAQPAAMGQALLQELEDKERAQSLQARYREIHIALRQNASETAAQALLALAST